MSLTPTGAITFHGEACESHARVLARLRGFNVRATHVRDGALVAYDATIRDVRPDIDGYWAVELVRVDDDGAAIGLPRLVRFEEVDVHVY